MFSKLIKISTAVSGQKARGRDNLSNRQSGGSPWWVAVAFVFMGLSLLVGCASPQQVITTQAFSKLQAPDPNKELQQQLMVQASEASLVNYRDYKVGPEDQLSILIFGQDNLNREVRVNGQGEITMPLVGVVKVAGMTPKEVETRLKELYDASFLVNPQITVEVKEFRHQRVAVTGAVAKPGSYEIIGPRTLLEVLSLAGGFANQGSQSNSGGGQAGDVVNVMRHQNAPDVATNIKAKAGKSSSEQMETMVIDLRRLISGKDPQLNIPIQNGDIVNVPFAGTAYVLGGVRKPGNIAVKENLTVAQAVALAGGVDPILGTNNITIMRFDDEGKPISINTNLNSIIARNNEDLPVKDNDVVVVNESAIKKNLYIMRTLLPIPSGSYGMGF